MTSNIIPISTTDLNLGDEEVHPRRLLPLSSENGLAAYGGEDGAISVLQSSEEGKDKENNSKWRIGRQFDDAIRAIAVSPDGERIAVGFDDGSTMIYCYDASSLSSDSATNNLHPFLKVTSSDNKDSSEEGEKDIYEDLLTQSDIHEGAMYDSPSSPSESSFSGPRMQAPIRDLQFHPTQKHFLVVASEACPGFCIVNVSSEQSLQDQSRLLESEAGTHHDGSGVRSVAFSPKSGNVLATLAMDGRLCLWSTNQSDTPEVDWELLHQDKLNCVPKKDVGEMLGADTMDRSCRPVWSEEGDYLALPGMVDIQLRHKGDWRKQLFVSSLGNDGHSDSIVGMAWGKVKDVRILATTGRDKRIVLWQISSNEKSDNGLGTYLCELSYDVKSLPHLPSFPTDIFFSHAMEKLFITMENSKLVTYSTNDFPSQPKVLEESQQEESEIETQSLLETQPMSQAAGVDLLSESQDKKRLHKSTKSNSKQEDDEEDDDIFNIQTDVATKNASFKSKFIADEVEEGSDEEEKEFDDQFDDINVKAPNKVQDQEVQDDASIHDFDVADDVSDLDRNFGTRNPMLYPSLPEPQAPFSPSATPLHEGISRRILCWNHIGTVTHRREGLDEFIIDISFVDAAVRRPISFPESYGFIIGSLGEDGAIFATDTEDDFLEEDDELNNVEVSERVKKMIRKKKKNKVGSRIFFHRYDTFGSLKEKDWSLALPADERVIGCASGTGWASVMTNQRYLRLFSSSGVQSNIIWLPGNPVTLIGRERFLTVIYHMSSPLPDSTQKLGYIVIDPISGTTIANGPMSALSPGATLTWAGFSEDLCTYILDSKGMLSILNNTHGWQWSPILDTQKKKKSSDDHFWPVTIADGKLVCIPLKGGNEYPDAVRRPVTASIGLKLPLVNGILGPSSLAMEETSVRAAIALKQKKMLNKFEIMDNPTCEDDLDDEYDKYCTSVVSI